MCATSLITSIKVIPQTCTHALNLPTELLSSAKNIKNFSGRPTSDGGRTLTTLSMRTVLCRIVAEDILAQDLRRPQSCARSSSITANLQSKHNLARYCRRAQYCARSPPTTTILEADTILRTIVTNYNRIERNRNPAQDHCRMRRQFDVSLQPPRPSDRSSTVTSARRGNTRVPHTRTSLPAKGMRQRNKERKGKDEKRKRYTNKYLKL